MKRYGYIIVSSFRNGEETYYSENINGDYSIEDDIRLAKIFDNIDKAAKTIEEELGDAYEIHDLEYEFVVINRRKLEPPQAP